MKTITNHARTTGRAIRRAVKSNEAYDILGKRGTWTAGGCWILAAALKRLLGRKAQLVAVTRGDERVAQHVAVKLADVYFDADGCSTCLELLRRWCVAERVTNAWLLPFDSAMASQARRAGIPFSAGKARKIAAYLAREIPTLARQPDGKSERDIRPRLDGTIRSSYRGRGQ